jgi:hypothetical protein
MKATGVDLKVVVDLRFTDAELRVLGRCSDMHYDYKCQSANFDTSKVQNPLDIGLIVKMRNYHRNTGTPTAGEGYRLEWGDIDTLTKICEMGFNAPVAVGLEDAKIATGLMFGFKRILERMNAVREGTDQVCRIAVGMLNEAIENHG